jgi:hypothetical protein
MTQLDTEKRITTLEVLFKAEKTALEEKIEKLESEITTLKKRVGAYDTLAAKAGGAFMALLALGTALTLGFEKAMHILKQMFKAGGGQ